MCVVYSGPGITEPTQLHGTDSPFLGVFEQTNMSDLLHRGIRPYMQALGGENHRTDWSPTEPTHSNELRIELMSNGWKALLM